jgi:hypothetical protein
MVEVHEEREFKIKNNKSNVYVQHPEDWGIVITAAGMVFSKYPNDRKAIVVWVWTVPNSSKQEI